MKALGSHAKLLSYERTVTLLTKLIYNKNFSIICSDLPVSLPVLLMVVVVRCLCWGVAVRGQL